MGQVGGNQFLHSSLTPVSPGRNGNDLGQEQRGRQRAREGGDML